MKGGEGDDKGTERGGRKVAEGGSGDGGAGGSVDETVVGGLDAVAEVVVAHGVDGDGSGGESGEAEEDDVDADGPKETETPEIETHHKR